jgi:hypothetical protein
VRHDGGGCWEILYAKELGKPIIGVARRLTDNVSSFVKMHATDIVDTWREDHIVNAIRGYGSEYRASVRAMPKAHAGVTTLPKEQPDTEVGPEPSPPSPDERKEPRSAELPREVLTREGLGKFVPGALSAYSARHPRWWWPFGHE